MNTDDQKPEQMYLIDFVEDGEPARIFFASLCQSRH
jgi:hypothetical protein